MAYFGPQRTRGMICDLLAQIDERNFGTRENLDHGDDVSDSELLNGFINAFEDEEPAGLFKNIASLAS